MQLFFQFSNLLNIVFSYVTINSSLIKNKKVLFILLLIVGATGSISEQFPSVNELFLFFFLFLASIKIDSHKDSFLILLEVSSAFLVVRLLSFVISKMIPYFISLSMDLIYTLIFSEIVLYILIFLSCSIIRKRLIPFIQYHKKENYIALIAIGFYIFLQINRMHKHYFHNQVSNLRIIIMIVISFSLLLYLFTFFVARGQRLQSDIEKQKLETKYMTTYAKETTKQYNELRKFKHDYTNILSSLDYYIQLKDMEKLSAYYKDVIQPTQRTLTKRTFTFQELNTIQSEEIKSILAIKLLAASDQDITINIEAPDVIPDTLPVSSSTLLRMFGIILDNSIEEVVNQENGVIHIGLFDMESHFLFIVKNSIRQTILPLHQLQVKGYSSKGENRGLGLSILRELSQREKKLTLETEITSTEFIQKIVIQKGVN